MHEKPNVQSAPLRVDREPCLSLLLHGSQNGAARTIAPIYPTKFCTRARFATGRWGCALEDLKRLERVPVPDGRSYCLCVGATRLTNCGADQAPDEILFPQRPKVTMAPAASPFFEWIL